MAGDKKSQEICFNLTQKASRPYLKSLDEWLMNGVINDPFDEVSAVLELFEISLILKMSFEQMCKLSEVDKFQLHIFPSLW